ncbi:MAG TPA: hypothetical protein DCQ63_15915, partial [Planktothrix sp. UBA8402]|nr:hypothetical protein [Planktothrix sp. UBA8402]
MEKLVVIRIGEGSFEQGFPVNLQISENSDRSHISADGKLPPFAQIPLNYTTWQLEYRKKLSGFRMMTLSDPVNSFSNLDLIKNGNLLK